ncbi:phosphotriesterase [bacterium LRH843]|nr:phosphotriesterase [bacterium LRH843]
MPKIQTVTGEVKIENLNYILMHEHLQIGYAGWHLDPFSPNYKRQEVIDRAVDRLQELKSYGVDCIVDPCPMELGRDPELMAEVSQRSGVYVVCSTGFDLEVRGKLFAIERLSSEEILEIYMKEIVDGIGDTGILPGIIKAATGHNIITEYEQKCLQAASKASISSGLPIITHTEFGTMGIEQIQLFKTNGVTPGKCIIGHCCANHNTDYHVGIMNHGAIVGFDRFGNEHFSEDKSRINTLYNLLEMGYSEQIIISCDSVCTYLGRFPFKVEYENWHPRFLFNTVIPQLKDMGIHERDIQNLIKNNPKRYFAL